MKTKLSLFIFAIGVMSFAQAQNSRNAITLSSSDKDTCSKIENNNDIIRTQGDNTVNYADSVLLLDYSVEIAQATTESGEIVINPKAKVQTTISMFVPETDYVCVKITDMQGRTIISSRRLLEEGSHIFKYDPGVGDASFFTAYWQGKKSSLKIEHSQANKQHPISLEYLGSTNENPQFQNQQGLIFDAEEEKLYSGKEKGL